MENHSQNNKLSLEPTNLPLIWLTGILFIALFAPTMAWLFERWTMGVWHNGHSILIACVVIYLVWKELQKNHRLTKSSSALGFALLIPALTLQILDTGIHTQLLSAVALFLALPGLSLLFMGVQRTKVILFPLSILLFTLPIPLAFTESIHLTLRHIAAKSVGWLLRQLGVPNFTSGTLIEIPNGALQVADACSGFSILYATVTIAILTAYMCPSIMRRVLILVIAIPLAISVNIIRVFVLTMLVHWIGLDVLATSAHEISGLLTFVVALPIIFWLGQAPIKE
ncbi:MAG: exosortase/archaeosortase family protein [Methyloprofundus sp.]|nr:exosortase/archaeosortase family protein [Methyloprofundus sp.]MDT8426768.1 exosortase/archaeosortase family protein [Methyloprofundus sp.]